MWLSDHLGQILSVLLVVTSAALVAWFILSAAERRRRRAYNLMPAETGGTAIRPDFLSIDRAKREAVLTQGEVLVAREAANTGSGASRLTRHLALGTAIVSFFTAAGAAVQRAGNIQELYGKTGYFWSHFAEILTRYWVGFAFAALVIAGNLIVLLHRLLDTSKK